MTGMADEDERAAARNIAPGFIVDFGHEGAGCIENGEVARDCVIHHGPGHAMRAENGYGTLGNIIEIFNEMSAFRLQPLHDMAIVNDFMAYINRRTIFAQGALNDLD